MHILYIEDDDDIRAITELVLDEDAFALTSCASGSEALKLAGGITPDLLLLDVMMPGLDGPATLLKLREFRHLKHTPVIFMTAKVQPSEIAQYKDLGALGVIHKPFDPATLARQIEQITGT